MVKVPAAKTDANALLGIKDTWLTYCQEIGPRPGSAVADMQQDFTALALAAGNCAADHGALVEYLIPYVQRARREAGITTP